LNFDDGGKLYFEEKSDSVHLSARGSWNFLQKQGAYKNKERVVLVLEKATGSTLYFSFLNQSQTTVTYRIRELRNKKLVLECTDAPLIVVAGVGSLRMESEYVFVQ
jgi:hypothetical protein